MLNAAPKGPECSRTPLRQERNAGLSPRLRGNLPESNARSPRRRTIPAPAGKPDAGKAASIVIGDYPRACGETHGWIAVGQGPVSDRQSTYHKRFVAARDYCVGSSSRAGDQLFRTQRRQRFEYLVQLVDAALSPEFVQRLENRSLRRRGPCRPAPNVDRTTRFIEIAIRFADSGRIIAEQ